MTADEVQQLRTLQMRVERMIQWLLLTGPKTAVANERRLIDQAYAEWRSLDMPRRDDSAADIVAELVR